MAKYGPAVQRPIDPQYLPNKRVAVYNRINLHETGGLGSPFGTFNRLAAASSHFCIMQSGTVEQFIDTANQAEADYEGNDATISIETEGGQAGHENDPWTPEQTAALIDLIKWLYSEHGFALKLATSSKIGDESKGLSWHRLGIDGNFPELPSRYAGRLQRGGGMHYSLSRGKVCPGNGKIDQIFDVIFPAISGQVTPPPPQPPVPPTPPPVVQKPNCTSLQSAVRTPADNAWGGNTDKNCDAVRAASNWGGNNFPYGKAFTQQVVGTTPDGIFGPKSWAAHDATVKAMQDALRSMGFDPGATDGIWGNQTEGAYQAARNACHI